MVNGKKINKSLLKKEDITDEVAFGYWDARLHREPPKLRTTFGNFTTLNSVIRIPITTSTTVDTVLIVFWSPSGLTVIQNGAVASNIRGSFTGSLFNCGGFAMRPLRLSYSLECTTQLVNVQGEVVVLNTDQALVVPIFYDAVPGAEAFVNGTFWPSITTLVFGSPDSVSRPAKEYLDHSQEYVLPPAGYTAYNSYYDIPTSTGFGGFGLTSSVINSQDMFSTFNASNFAPGAVPTYPYTVNTLVQASQILGDIPPMRIGIIVIPKTTNPQTYVLKVHRQDGVRFPNNSLGAAFQTTPVTADSKHEDAILSSIRRIAGFPSISFDSDLVKSIPSDLGGIAAGALSAFAGAPPGLAGMISSVVGNMLAKNQSNNNKKKRMVK